MENLFSYGTLQLPQVQQSLFGRLLEGTNEELPGYRVDELKISDRTVIEKSGTDMHPILVATGNPSDIVQGMVYPVTTKELQQADDYEVDDYQRTEVTMKSGVSAWIYAAS